MGIEKDINVKQTETTNMQVLLVETAMTALQQRNKAFLDSVGTEKAEAFKKLISDLTTEEQIIFVFTLWVSARKALLSAHSER